MTADVTAERQVERIVRDPGAGAGSAASDRRGILILGGKAKVLRKASTLGLKVLHVQKKEHYSHEHAAHVTAAFLVDYENSAVVVPLARAIHATIGFDWVLSLTEPGLLPAALINDALGLRGNSTETVRLLRDKSAMRRKLVVHGFSPVAFQAVVTAGDVRHFAASQGYPVVLKPVDGSASLGVSLVTGDEDAQRACRILQNLGFHRLIVEEFLSGPEVSVESFTRAGRHVVLAVTEKLTLPNFIEIGHAVPARLAEADVHAITGCVTRFLDIVGLREGPAHTEVRMTTRGPRIVEGHNRIGGDKINELVELAYGVDMDTLAVGCPLDLVDAPHDRPVMRQAAAIRFLTPPPGYVESVSGIDVVSSRPGVVEVELSTMPGSVIRPPSSNFDRAGYIITRGATTDDAVALCEECRDDIVFRTASTTPARCDQAGW